MGRRDQCSEDRVGLNQILAVTPLNLAPMSASGLGCVKTLLGKCRGVWRLLPGGAVEHFLGFDYALIAAMSGWRPM